MTVFSDVINYAYSNARVRAKKSFLLDEKTVRALADAKDLGSFVTTLESTHYRDGLHKLEKVDATSIEIALLENLVSTNTNVAFLAPERTRPFFESRSKKYEITAIKEIINSKTDDSTAPERIKDHSFMLSREVKVILPKLIDVKDFEEIVELFKSTEYGNVLGDMLGSYKELGSVLPFMVALDRYYFTRLWDKLKTLDKSNRMIAENFIGIEIDAINIMTILRAKAQKFEAERFVVPISYAINTKKCVEAEEVSDVLEMLSNTPYDSALKSAMPVYEKTGSLLPFELNLKRYVVERTMEGLSGYPFQIGALIGYLRLKDREVENLRAIAVGVENGLPPEDIRALIV